MHDFIIFPFFARDTCTLINPYAVENKHQRKQASERDGDDKGDGWGAKGKARATEKHWDWLQSQVCTNIA